MAKLYRFFQQGNRCRQGVSHGLALAAKLRVAAYCGAQRAVSVALVIGLLQQRQGLTVEQVGMRVDAYLQRLRDQWHQRSQ
ncbi:hypothetical protein D3C72_2266280 [compost metagenome]